MPIGFILQNSGVMELEGMTCGFVVGGNPQVIAAASWELVGAINFQASRFLLRCADGSSGLCFTNIEEVAFAWNRINSTRFVDEWGGGAPFEEKVAEGGRRGKDGINVEFLLRCFVESIGSRMKGGKEGFVGDWCVVRRMVQWRGICVDELMDNVRRVAILKEDGGEKVEFLIKELGGAVVEGASAEAPHGCQFVFPWMGRGVMDISVGGGWLAVD